MQHHETFSQGLGGWRDPLKRQEVMVRVCDVHLVEQGRGDLIIEPMMMWTSLSLSYDKVKWPSNGLGDSH